MATRPSRLVPSKLSSLHVSHLPEIMETRARAHVVAVFKVKDIAQQQGTYATIVKGGAISLLYVAIIPEKFIQ